MEIKTVHAYFAITTGNYTKEQIGFSIKLGKDETLEEVIPELRERAKNIIGKRAADLYAERRALIEQCDELTNRLDKLRKEWDATAEFLKAQGLNPVAPSMPQFRNLLSAVTVDSEVVSDEDDDYEEDDDDYR